MTVRRDGTLRINVINNFRTCYIAQYALMEFSPHCFKITSQFTFMFRTANQLMRFDLLISKTIYLENKPCFHSRLLVNLYTSFFMQTLFNNLGVSLYSINQQYLFA